jgi:ATP-dependent DNA helicase
MDEARRAHAEKRAEAAAASKSKSTSTSTANVKARGKAKAKSAPQTGKGRGKPAKRPPVVADSYSDDEGEEADADAKPADEATDIDVAAFPQPALVTGGKLKDYQLQGLQWMVGLHQHGISGILGKSSCLSLYYPPFSILLFLFPRPSCSLRLFWFPLGFYCVIDRFVIFAAGEMGLGKARPPLPLLTLR